MSDKVNVPDRSRVLLGLGVFLVVLTIPLWVALATRPKVGRPQLEKPKDAKACVESVEYMRDSHMALLDFWRDDVVRNGKRIYTSDATGERHEMSLTRTCLGCHADKSQFCDKCHDFVGESPYCWDCHVDTTAEGR